MLLVVVLGWEHMSPLAGAGSLVAWGGVALFVASVRGPDFGSAAVQTVLHRDARGDASRG